MKEQRLLATSERSGIEKDKCALIILLIDYTLPEGLKAICMVVGMSDRRR